MKTITTALAAMTLALGVAACSEATDEAGDNGAGSIAGVWKANVDSAEFENDVNTYVIAGGDFTCESCIPPYTVTADGEWQSVDRPGVDGIKVSIIDDNSLETASRFGDKELGKSLWTVGEDGQSMTINWTNMDGEEVTEGSTMFTRAGAAPEGSHAASGNWTVSDIGEMSEAALLFTYALEGNRISSSGNGGGYTATLGGDAVTPEGDESGGVIAVEKIGENSYRETYSRDGEVVNVLDMTIEGDTMSAVSTDPRDESVVRWTATRQR